MRKNIKKIASICLCGVILSSSCIALTTDAQQSTDKSANTIKPLSNEKLKDIVNTADIDKDETVYIIAAADGSAKKVIVNGWLKNPNNSATITDVSNLNDIKNLKSDLTFTNGNNNEKIWQANGEDIFYSGTTDEKLPVDVKITYKLDNKEISADELKGKSGKVAIEFSYTNNAKKTVTIDGKDEEVNIPFAVISGMILDNKKFTNISIDNGRIINDGDRCIALGFALPGLAQNLDISADELELPEKVTVTADVKEFELDTTLTLATNEIFSCLNTDKISSLGDIQGAINQISTATKQLTDGSSQLSAGLEELLSKTKELNSGADKLNEGASQLKDGSSKLYQGSTELKSGLYDLNNGMSTLQNKTKLLIPGINDLSSGVTTLDSKSGELKKGVDLLAIYSEQLKNGSASLKTNSAPLFDGLNQLNNGLKTLDSNSQLLKDGATQTFNILLKSVHDQLSAVAAQINSANGTNLQIPELTIANYAATLDAIAQQLPTPDLQEKVLNAKNQLNSYKNFYDGLNAYTSGVTSAASNTAAMNEGAKEVSKGISLLADGSSKLDAGALQLQDGTNQLVNGTAKLKAGTDTLNNSTGTLVDGINMLADGSDKAYKGSSLISSNLYNLSGGASTLYDGTSELKTGTDKMVDGVSQLSNGAKQLNDGIDEFCNTINSKLAQFDIAKIQSLISRIKATSQASKDYETFSGIPDGMTGKVKFIFKTEEIR